MNEKERHLSYSQINGYMVCPLKYRFNYIDGLEPEFTPSALQFGHAIHSGIQAFLQSALEADPLQPDQLVDIYRQEWTRSDGLPIRYSSRESENSLLSTAKEMFGLFVEKHDSHIEVIAVEEEFTLDLSAFIHDYPGELPSFKGYIDAILKNGSTALVDYKTSARKPNGDVNATQLVAYSLGSQAIGYDPNELDFRYDYLTKTAKPELIPYQVSIDDNDRRRFLKTVARVWKAIQTGVFYPNPSYLCGSCGYQRHCKDW